MKNSNSNSLCFITTCILFLAASCNSNNKKVSTDTGAEIDLKRGEIVSCGPPEKEFGTVGFENSCSDKVKADMELGMALLHSFEYDEAEKAFAKVIDEEPDCAMAYWGVAMSNYHPLWAPPTQEELAKGSKVIAIAKTKSKKTERESAYIDAIAQFYKDWDKLDHRTRSGLLGTALEKIHTDYPDDKEAAIFYSLALTASADPADKTYANQKKAVGILESLNEKEPNHPGIIHYIIHSYDNPELASLALPAARKYASIAPSSAHARHMPSHIFTRLGLWDEGIQSNLVAAESAKCYAESTGIKGNWDEELHALDYLVYGYLQKGDNVKAKEKLDYIRSIKVVLPMNFKVAYSFAASPARYVLENKMWKEASELPLQEANIDWQKFPWQKAIHHFTRLLGSVHTGKREQAKAELNNLMLLYNKLEAEKNSYQANQVMIQVKTSKAWMTFKDGKTGAALALMNEAATMEDKTEKHSVTPGEVLPARELYADMLMLANKPAEALLAYESDLKTHNNRFNGLFGAAQAAERTGDLQKANTFYQQLVNSAKQSGRPEMDVALKFLNQTRASAKL